MKMKPQSMSDTIESDGRCKYPRSIGGLYEEQITDNHLECHRLVGLVVKASAFGAEGPGFESRLRRHFFGVESYQ